MTCPSDAPATQRDLAALERQIDRQQAEILRLIDSLQRDVETVRAAGGPVAFAAGERVPC